MRTGPGAPHAVRLRRVRGPDGAAGDATAGSGTSHTAGRGAGAGTALGSGAHALPVAPLPSPSPRVTPGTLLGISVPYFHGSQPACRRREHGEVSRADAGRLRWGPGQAPHRRAAALLPVLITARGWGLRLDK